MSYWDIEIGKLPTLENPGLFQGQTTFLATCNCGCGEPMSVFAKTLNVCLIQTLALNAEKQDLPFETYLRRIEMSGLVQLQTYGLMLETFELMISELAGDESPFEPPSEVQTYSGEPNGPEKPEVSPWGLDDEGHDPTLIYMLDRREYA
jgi:hypothetical protein